ncbi:MAG TPA: hypothetical protein VLC93_13090, partial [Myxococcota bacterium]|nr:hypothetical protein [Myxococcota bacterium]
LTLTDDGGAFIVDSVASEYDPTPGDPDAYRDGGIFAAKLPAKDSVASWRPDQVTAHGFTTALTSCTVTQSAWGPAIGNFTATAHASEVERSTFDQTPTGLLE